MPSAIDLFVPGRVCLFGEHSDWAGAYRRFNSEIPPGQVIISGTNQGLFARASAAEGRLVIRSTLSDGNRCEPFSLPMEREALLKEAEAGSFYSYAAGVAYHMLTFYEVGGLELDNYKTTLPVKKGLSSSAALCVMVVRAFNRIYDLKLTIRAEMEAAYQGEIHTPSRCGRMDQGCAFGQNPVLMTFDSEFLRTRRITVNDHLYLLIGDLKGEKDTIKILADLNRAYPFPGNDQEKKVQEYLGEINVQIVERAAEALAEGDAAKLGQLMTEAQEKFDSSLMEACPEELTSPKLHKVLEDPEVKKFTYGGKGVGSQGDGCVQLVAKDARARKELGAYLTDTYKMDCFDLDLAPPESVKKAIIPAAGFGTRMFPATKNIKKELFPVITPDGLAKPIILAIVEEAVASGIEEIAIVIRPEDENSFRELFAGQPSPAHYSKLSQKAREYCRYLHTLASRITFIIQKEQEGFGHAVYCTREWVGNEPFLLLLGDHIYASNTDVPCARQLIDSFNRHGRKSVVGLYRAAEEEISHYGTVTGDWIDDEESVIEITEFAEKPSIDYARTRLVTPGLGPGQFLCLYGQYVISPKIFEHLEEEITAGRRESGEIQLTTALESVRHDEGMLGYIVQGEHYDTGLPETYLHSINAYFRSRTGKTPESDRGESR